MKFIDHMHVIKRMCKNYFKMKCKNCFKMNCKIKGKDCYDMKCKNCSTMMHMDYCKIKC